MKLTFHSYGSGGTDTTLELDERQSSIIEKLNEPTRLALTLTSETAPMITLGAHITYQGVTYYVTSEPTVRKEHSKLFVVETELETSIGLARHVILSNPVDKRASFDYTATATEHLQLAIDSLNGKFAADRISWSRGAVNCKDTTKHLKYDGITVWEALQQIREAYETDIFVYGSTISLGREGDKSNALPLAYGKGKGLLSGLERLKHNDDTTPMCLYVTGTKRNMSTGRLTLERSQLLKVTDTGIIQRNPTDLDGQIYTTDSTGQCIADYSADNVFAALYTEATYTNEEIYPSHVSTIKTVTKVKDHFEVNSDFDYSKLLIDGEAMQVVFQTGNLAGRDFDARYYTGTGRLAIVPKEEDDTTLPNDTLCPKVGDQYIVTGIKLPDKYIKEAQRKLTDDALRHLVKLQRQRYSYKAEIDPVYLHNNHDKIATQLTVGRYVHLTDPHIAVGDPYIRIVGKRTYLDRPYQPEIELSNEIEPPSLLASILDQIDNSSLLDRLRNGMKGVEHLSVSINNLTSDATDIKQRLAGAEEALTGKLDSSSFNSWKAGDLAKLLAGKQNKGNYVDPSELATSQQQAVSEAVKRAGEMDKKIKVGGRNLITRASLWKATTDDGYGWVLESDKDNSIWLSKQRDYPQAKAGDTVTLSMLIRCDKSEWGASEWSIRVADSQGTLKYLEPNKEVFGEFYKHVWTFDLREDGKLPIIQLYNHIFRRDKDGNIKFNKHVEAKYTKLERGAISTDWTPATEDVAESISTVNTSLTALASTLLDPTTGEIHKLTSQLESHGKTLGSQAEALSEQSQRLTTAEEAIRSKLDSSSFEGWQAGDYAKRQSSLDEELRKKLGSEDFSKWKAGDLAKALASKQPAGSYVVPSELATSQQQAVSEAVKRAEEMDKQIKVVGRNLLIGEIFRQETTPSREIWLGDITSIIDNNNLIGETVTWSFDLRCDKACTFRVYQLGKIWFTDYKDATVEAGEWKRFSFTGVVRDTGNPTGSTDRACNLVVYGKYGSGYYPITRHHKLERGSIATDWTPAPEDLDDSISKVSSQIERHKTETEKNFDDLATHPLTVDDNGYWRIWNLKQQQYVTTQYKSRGEDGQDAGRYLGRAKRIHPDFNGNYLLETEDSWRTAKEGDYVYLVGDLSNRGGDKDTYYIVRERKSSTVWDKYDIKGHTPVFSLDDECRLLADNQLVSQYSLKPSPEEVVGTSAFAKQLSAKIDESEKIKTLETEVGNANLIAQSNARDINQVAGIASYARGAAQAAVDQIATFDTEVTDLNKRSLTADQRDEVAYLTSSLPQLRSADGKTKLQGLSLQRYITLSSDGDSVSAYLASDALTAVLKAGITNFGTPQEKENVAINHNGSGHFGNLYFQGNQIDFRTSQSEAPYLSVGAAEANFIDNFLNSARVDNTPVSIRSTTLPDSSKLPDSSAYTLKRTFGVTNDGTRITISIDSLKVETYKPNKAYIVLDGVVLDTWQGHISTGIARLPDGTVEANPTPVPYTASNLIYERTLRKGTHMVQIILETPNSSDKVTLSGFKVRQRYDTGLQQSLLTKSGLRLYGAPDRYLDVDYRKQYFNTVRGTAIGWMDNDYTLRVKGGAKVDKLTADELDVPGVPLCGATFDESGSQVKAFGKYVNRQGYGRAQAVYYSSGNFYRVFHSIGHTRYMPTLQIVDDNGNDINWNLSARIYAVNANDFAVRILTNGDRPIKHAFAFVAFKTM